VNPVKREIFSLALSETTHALRYAESAARRFTNVLEEQEAGSKLAISVGYIQNRLSEAQASLEAAEQEIHHLIQEVDVK
jgi:hypothetical protein